MNELETALQEVTIGNSSAVHNFTIFPLLGASPGEPGYVVLRHALLSGAAFLKETSESGTVPSLTLVNIADRPVLLVDGEELIGCKQNRILNTTILAPARSEISIPVSCVEQGRWRYQSSQFEESNHSLYAGLRAKKSVQVSQSLASNGVPFTAQDVIWSDLADKAERLGSSSSTGAMSGIFERRERDIRKYVNAARWVPTQVGALFAINGRFVGVELFDSDKTCGEYLEKIASGYALDAIDYFTPVYPVPTVEEATRFVERVSNARQARFNAVGLGEDIRLHGQDFTGATLVVNGKIVHLCGFDLAIDSESGFGKPSNLDLEQWPIRRGTLTRRGSSQRGQ